MRLLIICLILIGWTFASHGENLDAEGIVRGTTQEVLNRLDADRELLAADPSHIQTIVRELIVPHFDFETMTSLAMGSYRDELSESERACVTEGFRNLLVERYADILLSYHGEAIVYDPAQPIGKRGYIVIRQTLDPDGTRPLPIDYPVNPEQGKLRIADLIVDGVSLVKNYRKTFHYEIEKKGLKQFIDSFPECNNP
jgi:phospholipid transport system substrate-binding protein